MVDARPEIEAKLAEQRRLRGVAIENGFKPRNNSDIAALSVQLDALDDAAAEAARRDREQAAREQVANAQALKAELGRHVANYLAAIREAETSLRAAAAAIGKVLEHAAAIARVSHAVSSKPAPLSFGVVEVARRMGMTAAAIMGSIPGHAHRLGAQEWTKGHQNSGDDVFLRESNFADRHIRPLIDGE